MQTDGTLVVWDFENCSVPQDVTFSEAVIRIRDALKRYGEIAQPNFCVYANSRLLESISDEEAEANHVTKISVMTKGKDSADKLIIADIWKYAWDNLKVSYDQKHTPEQQYKPPAIVVISTDMDFFESLKNLKDRGHTTVVIHGASVHQSVSDCCLERIDWFKLVRGINFDRPRRRIDVDEALRRLETCLETMVMSDKLIVTEKNVRASMKYDGAHNNEIWETLSSEQKFKDLLGTAIKQQETTKSFDPSNASFESFSIITLGNLYRVLLKNSGLKKNGKYPMAVCLNAQLDGCYPLAQVMEFVELSFRVGWISKEGSSYYIKQGLMQQIPMDVILPRQDPVNPINSPPKSSNSISASCVLSKHQYGSTVPVSQFDYLSAPPQPNYSPILSQSNPCVWSSQQSNPSLLSGRQYIHHETSPQSVERPVSFGYQTPNSSRTISEESGKAALQYYFQTELKSLPQYESRKTGKDHLPVYEVAVHVPLLGSSFFGYGKSNLKKQSEKQAAQDACNKIIERVPGYKFPSNFYTDL